MTTPLYIASGNAHKIEELSAMLAPLGYDVHGLKEFPDYESPEETGSTFHENARIKALALTNHLQQNGHKGFCVLADDSGLEVHGLARAPGVHSARYAGANATDADNNQKLVNTLKAMPQVDRSARYVCNLCFVDANGGIKDVEAYWDGLIVLEPQGKNGFGYDPYFWVESHGKTVAELPAEIKNELSHRAKALKALLEILS